ncbi:hypothetical protein Tco_1214973 [Tanacetum coccineum]
MHNNIMAAGSRDRPPMLATGRYAQWRSRFLRYIATRPNGDALRKCILKGPYTLTIVTTPAVPATEDSPAVPEQTTVETVMIMTPENRAHFESEKEAIHLIFDWELVMKYTQLLDACQTASRNVGEASKMMNEMIRNNLTVATMQVNVQFLQQLHPELSRFNGKNANPLALVATAQTLQDSYYQTSKSHKSYAPTSKASLPTRSHATTRHKGKEIAKPITPPSESAFEKTCPKTSSEDKDQLQKIWLSLQSTLRKSTNLQQNNLRTSSNTETRMWILSKYKDGHRWTVWESEGSVQLQAEQSDWLADTNEEIDEQELEAHYNYMAKIQEVPNADSCTDSEPLE